MRVPIDRGVKEEVRCYVQVFWRLYVAPKRWEKRDFGFVHIGGRFYWFTML